MFSIDAGIVTNNTVGCNLATSLSENGYDTALFYTPVAEMQQKDKIRFAKEYEKLNIDVVNSLNNLILLLKKPRVIFIIGIKNDFSDKIIPDLLEYLEEGDILIDTCDTGYKNAVEKGKYLSKLGIHYLDAGYSGEIISGLKGSSFMVGGLKDAYDYIRPMLVDVSSKVEGFPCCPYFGKIGTGQYIKMLHNGIEYGVLQLMCEAVNILRNVTKYETSTLSEILSEWNTGELESNILDMVIDVISREDNVSETPLIDLVLDKVGYSDSVVSLCINALELNHPVSIISTALDTRFLSNMREERVAASDILSKQFFRKTLSDYECKMFTQKVKEALYLCIIFLHAQAFSLLTKASLEYSWNINILDVARTYQGGLIIRSRLMYRIIDVFSKAKQGSLESVNFLNNDYFKSLTQMYITNLREVLALSNATGLPSPCMNACLSYIDTYTNNDLPTGLIQLVRDYVGVTGFERKDKQDGNKFFANWQNPEIKTESINRKG